MTMAKQECAQRPIAISLECRSVFQKVQAGTDAGGRQAVRVPLGTPTAPKMAVKPPPFGPAVRGDFTV
ncbi:hypothetical protein DB345_07035 [Spartobacteria bacterium LR76]|nr:hypothetical protein DB345_07035 [Spartobacteria bacterium LR76]